MVVHLPKSTLILFFVLLLLTLPSLTSCSKLVNEKPSVSQKENVYKDIFKIKIGSRDLLINNSIEYQLNAPVIEINDQSYIPLRFFLDYLGAEKVIYDPKTEEITFVLKRIGELKSYIQDTYLKNGTKVQQDLSSNTVDKPVIKIEPEKPSSKQEEAPNNENTNKFNQLDYEVGDAVWINKCSISKTKDDFQEAVKFTDAKDFIGLEQLLRSGRAMVLENIQAKIIEIDQWNAWVRIRITSGQYNGEDGWTYLSFCEKN